MVWRLPPLAVANSLLPSLEQQLGFLQHQLIAATSGPVDELYSRIGLVNGMFFQEGWGDLGVVNLSEDIKLMQSWPPPGLKLNWKRIDQGTRDGMAYKLFEGTFPTPCVNRVYDALPPESRVGRVQLLVPGKGADGAVKAADVVGAGGAPAAALHLAATGDQGFGRRLRLAFPLLKEGVCSLVHESPFYGARRPEAQKGSKLLRVSDLLALGWATIYESMNLLHWLTNEGYQEGGLCMTGLSMGGVHSCMTSALYPHEVATAALLAPRSAAIAYCDGALSAAMAWQPLLKEADQANNNVLKVINTAAQPVDVMREATYALAELELAWEAASAAGTGVLLPADRPTGLPVLDGPSSDRPATGPGGQAQVPSQQQQQQQVSPDASAAIEAVTEVAAWLRAGGLQGAGGEPQPAAGGMHHVHGTTTHAAQQGPPQHAHHHAGQQHHAQAHAGAAHAGTHRPGAGAPRGSTHGGSVGGQVPAQVWSQGSTSPQGGGSSGEASSSFSLRSLADTEELNKVVSRLVKGLSEINHLSLADLPMERQKTNRRLKHVLETYTDITRFPVPRRPDAAVFVAATHDAYVTTESVKQLSDYWAGSEMRLVSGGHVTGFLMHQDKFRDAIVDSIKRLKQSPPAAPAEGPAVQQKQQKQQQ